VCPREEEERVDYQASIFDQVRDETGELSYRFCFRDGMLVDKQIIREPTP
jgi:hypothetical protein